MSRGRARSSAGACRRHEHLHRVELNAGEIEKLSDQRVISGLPAELHLQTRERTILSYFMKPFTDQIARTFRER